jgi:glycerophosphoryl diester phosphodiesterase
LIARQRQCGRLLITLFASIAVVCRGAAADTANIGTETIAAAQQRHEHVAKRRKGISIICHRGASEHAHENTLEAYRATFELGGDGNEIDIRSTKDGVLVCFHDDMLDQQLFAFGDVGDYTWNELQQFQFRDPGRFGRQCRIPTLVEVFELHRKYAGLLHLDIKQVGLDTAIAGLLTRMDMWDHVAYVNRETGGSILRDARLKALRYKAALYIDRSDMFQEKIAAALLLPGNCVIVDDPRGVALGLGRKFDKLSSQPVAPKPAIAQKREMASEVELIATLNDAQDWNRIALTPDERAISAQHILRRAQAADSLLQCHASSAAAFAALEERVRNRSLHKDWRYHGLDGATALRALILLHAPKAIEASRFALWRDDPALRALAEPNLHQPPALLDWRIKSVVFPALTRSPSPNVEELCRDYLKLSDEEAARIGPSYFESAANTMLAIRPSTDTAVELLRHRIQAVRGRAILDCAAHADEAWARTALERAAPYALAYRATHESAIAAPVK